MRTRRYPAEDRRCGWYELLPEPGPARRLEAEERADCVVVGAGFTGLAAARRLVSHREDWRVVLVDAQRVGPGASGRNSGFIVDVGHCRPRLGIEGNRRLITLGRAGLHMLGDLVAEHGIDCRRAERGRLHGAVGDAARRELQEMHRGLDALGEPYTPLDDAAMEAVTGTTHYRAMTHAPGAATVQPAALGARPDAAAERLPVRGMTRPPHPPRGAIPGRGGEGDARGGSPLPGSECVHAVAGVAPATDVPALLVREPHARPERRGAGGPRRRAGVGDRGRGPHRHRRR